MRVGISLILLGLLLFQAILLLPLTQLSLEAHRKEVKEKLSTEEAKEDLLRLSFSRKELRELEWEKPDEFAYRGWMYDVVNVERKDGRFQLTVYRDKRETKMRERHRALRKGTPQGKEKDGDRIQNVRPFKYFQTRAPLIQDLRSPRVLSRAHPFRRAEELFLGVPVPPPC